MVSDVSIEVVPLAECHNVETLRFETISARRTSVDAAVTGYEAEAFGGWLVRFATHIKGGGFDNSIRV